MNSGLKLWQRAKQAIPGGNGLLSKRPERYAPDIWPTYFSKAKGVEIWDLDGNKFIDMAQMGIGSAILGYCDDDVDRAI
jgi:glutamate-1-semialdehyde aminotransferase